ncbi:MAG: hypothetical protein ACREYC_24710 [Gammaproteobacteria bacterium]
MTERAAAEVRAGELEARAADLNKELERVHGLNCHGVPRWLPDARLPVS